MFSLIITIISIALVAALALATIYYGGSAFNKGGAEAKASQFINEGQQINGAATLAKTDVEAGTKVGTAVDTLAKLQTEGYLAQVPAGWAVAGDPLADGAFATAVAPSVKVCEAINVKAGFTAAEITAGIDDLAGKAFGCLTDTTAVQYKL